jgi:hypothetical protein
MYNIQKIGAIAAFVNVFVAMATLYVAIVLIGPAVFTDPAKLIDMAIHNPTPLIIQDALKYISAGISFMLIAALFMFCDQKKSTALTLGVGFGFLAAFCLVINASLSMFAVSKATTFLENGEMGIQLNFIISLFALAVLLLNGIWLILFNFVALKEKCLPKKLAYLGLTMGVLNLVPPLALLALVLSIFWSIWIGLILIKKQASH